PALLIRRLLRVLEETHGFRLQFRSLLFPRLDQGGLGLEFFHAPADFGLRADHRLPRLGELPTLGSEAILRGPEVLLYSVEFHFALVDSFLVAVFSCSPLVAGCGEN